MNCRVQRRKTKDSYAPSETPVGRRNDPARWRDEPQRSRSERHTRQEASRRKKRRRRNKEEIDLDRAVCSVPIIIINATPFARFLLTVFRYHKFLFLASLVVIHFRRRKTEHRVTPPLTSVDGQNFALYFGVRPVKPFRAIGH